MKYVYIEGFYNEYGEGINEVTQFSSREVAVKYSIEHLESVLRDNDVSSRVSDVTDLVKELNGKVDKYSGHWSIEPDGVMFGMVKEVQNER